MYIHTLLRLPLCKVIWAVVNVPVISACLILASEFKGIIISLPLWPIVIFVYQMSPLLGNLTMFCWSHRSIGETDFILFVKYIVDSLPRASLEGPVQTLLVWFGSLHTYADLWKWAVVAVQPLNLFNAASTINRLLLDPSAANHYHLDQRWLVYNWYIIDIVNNCKRQNREIEIKTTR